MSKKTSYEWSQIRYSAYRDSCMHYAEENFVASWHHLFLWAEALWELDNTITIYHSIKERSARQKEIQRLWQQRGMLERLYSNLKNFHKELKYSHENFEADIIQTSMEIVQDYISFNRQSVASVKERIPK